MGILDRLNQLLVALICQVRMHHEQGMDDAWHPEGYTEEYIEDCLQGLRTQKHGEWWEEYG